MIRQLRIQNFQSHKDTVLKFHPGVNVILGSSDAGKSAILRALFWALRNRPLGDGFRSDWGGETAVTVTFDDNRSITRVKGAGGKNQYLLDEQTGTLTFNAFGNDPPEEIVQAHNLDEQLNIQSQIDPFFLLQSSPGEVARYLNRIAHLDDIDRVVKGLDSHYRRLNNEKAQLSAQLNELEQDLARFDGLESIEADLTNLEFIDGKLNSVQQKIRRYQDAVRKVEQLQEKVADQKRRLSIEPLVRDCEEILAKIDRIEKRQADLVRLRRSILRRRVAVERAKRQTRMESAVENALKLSDDLEGAAFRHSRLRGKLDRLTQLRERIKDAKRKIKRLEKQLPGVCPTCGTVLK